MCATANILDVKEAFYSNGDLTKSEGKGLELVNFPTPRKAELFAMSVYC